MHRLDNSPAVSGVSVLVMVLMAVVAVALMASGSGQSHVLPDQLRALGVLGIVMLVTAIVTLAINVAGRATINAGKKGFKTYTSNSGKIHGTIVGGSILIGMITLTLPQFIGAVICVAFIVGLIASSPTWAKVVWVVAMIVGVVNAIMK